MLKQTLFALGFAVIGLMLLPSIARADDCTSQYGNTNCTTANVVITKQVKNPITNVYVKNLGSNDATFSGDQTIYFKIIITNNTSTTIGTMTVKDVFPTELTFVNGPGTFDTASNTETFTLSNVNPGESRTEDIIAKVDASKVNKAHDVTCTVNSATATWDNGSVQDTAQLCIRTNVLGTTTLPVAGVNEYALLLPFTLLGIVGIGFLLKAH